MGRKWMMLVCGYALFQLLFDCIFGDTPQFFQGFFEAIAIVRIAARPSIVQDHAKIVSHFIKMSQVV